VKTKKGNKGIRSKPSTVSKKKPTGYVYGQTRKRKKAGQGIRTSRRIPGRFQGNLVKWSSGTVLGGGVSCSCQPGVNGKKKDTETQIVRTPCGRSVTLNYGRNQTGHTLVTKRGKQ